MMGFSLPYTDGEARVTGRIEYVLNMSLPGMLYAAVLRSPYPHAHVVRIDARAAEAVPGIAVVLTREDFVGNPDVDAHFGPIIKDQPIVAIDKVRYVGEPVAAVAAVDRETAEYAAELIEVEYEELPAVLEIEDALAPDSPLVHETSEGRQQHRTSTFLRDVTGTNDCNCFTLIKGDVARGMAEADHIFENVFRTPAAQQVPLEPHVAVARMENRRITVWSATQTPYIVRAQIAELFHLPQNRVRVVVPTLGGGYGAKTQPKIEPLTVALAWKAGAPVKLTLTRAEEFVTICKHEAIIKLRTGVKANGELVAMEGELWWNGGAYADRSPSVAEAGGYVATGPYRVPHVTVTSRALYTNRPPAGAFRGFGAAQAAWAYESQMDIIAGRLGLDPLEFRRQNLLRPGDTFSTGETLHDIALRTLLDHTAEAIGWGRHDLGPDPLTKARGKGIAVTIKGMITPATSTAMLRINADGSCSVLASTVEMGQGSNTILTQIAGDELGLPYEQVTVVHPDTDVTPFDLSTNSSRSTYSMGNALRLAVADAKQQAVRLAAELLGADPTRLEVRDGGVYARGAGCRGSGGLTFAELIRRAGCGNIMGTGTHQTQGGLDPHTGQGIGSTHWHHAAAGAEVEVDRETGKVTLLAIHAALYTGRSVNPVNIELQTEGNVIFGIGKALLEELIFDNGQLINGNLGDYMIPSFEDLPRRLTTSAHQNPDPEGECHGVGETALPPIAPAIGNAISNAIGVRVMRLPITPEKILRGLKEGREIVQAPQENLEELA
ncbi:MAG TPA: xanthine dehydrogenase subunit D [Chloroflexi bacterium]|nr:xanthine dehydrogenase subunit D [Chloroflexota bacterium]